MMINCYSSTLTESRKQKNYCTDTFDSSFNSKRPKTLPTIQDNNSTNTIDEVPNINYPPANFIDHNELLNTVSDIKDLNFDTLEISGRTNENLKITGANEKQTQALKKIFKKIPGLISTIGRGQYGHSYTVDKHILAVTKSVYNDPDFKTLDNHDKKLLLTAALMHDIQKDEGGSDYYHPQKGAKFAYKELGNLPEYSEDDRTTISNLIYNHHFNADIDYDAEKIAKLCAKEKEPDKFLKMLKILGKADLNGNPRILVRHPDFMPKIENTSIPLLKNIIHNLTQSESIMKSQLSNIPFPFK